MGPAKTEHHRFSNSTNVATATYDRDDRQMIVRFESGRRYLYSAVSPKLWESFVHSPSPGHFVMNTLIRYGPRELPS